MPQPNIQSCVWLPIKDRFYERVITISTGHTARSVDIIFALQFHATDLFNLRYQIVNQHEFARTKIDRYRDQIVTMHDHIDPFHTIVDIHKTARLAAIAPDRNAKILFVNCLDDFTANSRWRFLSATIPGAPWAVHIVKASDKGLHSAFRPVFLAKHF